MLTQRRVCVDCAVILVSANTDEAREGLLVLGEASAGHLESMHFQRAIPSGALLWIGLSSLPEVMMVPSVLYTDSRSTLKVPS